MKFGSLLVLLCCLSSSAFAASVFTTRPDDPGAVYVAPANGTADETQPLQAAIDEAAARNGGIVFVPSGRYRITRTVYLWRGVRLIGYGRTRPIFELPPDTPGYQKGMGLMVMFAGMTPEMMKWLHARGYRVAFPPPGTVPPDPDIPDANPGTFYSAMSNIDFRISKGNPAAVAIREHAAQHAFLTHMDFDIGSGLAAIYEVGNESEDLHFHGGRYAIMSEKTSPAWQFTLIDSTFDGQREAAIREHLAGLTLVHDSFRNVPVAIDIDPHYYDELWVRDTRFDNVSQAAILISDEHSPMNEIGVQDAICRKVPTFARFRESGKTLAGAGRLYEVDDFAQGVVIAGEAPTGRIATHYRTQRLVSMPASLPPAIRSLPPTTAWVNVHTLGVKGDGKTDDTAAIQKAVNGHRVLYFPSGNYIVRSTITLQPDSVLIALHPDKTQIDLPDNTPGFQGVGTPEPVVEAPAGGNAIISGIGVFTGYINPRAVGILWKSGAQSLMDDVQFLGGGGTDLPKSVLEAFYGDRRGDQRPLPYAYGRWDGQYPSLWVLHGGGTFADIWTNDTYAQAGFMISDTRVPGRVYELSNEHHLFNEVKLDHVQNWDFYAPQSEEEAATSAESVSLEIDWSKNITIANYHGYRVTRTHAPFPAAVRIYNSSGIHFRNVEINAESGYGICDQNGCGTFLRADKYPYDNAVQDMTHGLDVREHEFAQLDIAVDPPTPTPDDASAVVAPGAQVKRLADGFHSASGAAVGPDGTLYFVDHHQQRIYSWSQKSGIDIVRANPLDPVNLAFDKSGDLMVLSSAGPVGTVYAFRPGATPDHIQVIPRTAASSHPAAAVAFPGNYWINGEFRGQLDLNTYQYKTLGQMFAEDVTLPKKSEYVSPDGSLVLPAGRVFRQGNDGLYPGIDPTGFRWSDNLDSYGFVSALPGQRIYVADDSTDCTYSARVNANGTIGDLQVFAQRGGESVAEDAKGDVYIANGEVFVYDPQGRQIGEIDVPERPIDIVFGGVDGHTLFMLGHHALYAVKTQSAGQKLPWLR